MRTILLSLLVFATLLLFSSAAPLDKAVDGFNRILGLDISFLEKNVFSKKIKPPGKPPGPNLFPEAQSFQFLSQAPTKMFPKIKPFGPEDDQERKKHLFKKYHRSPFQKEPKDFDSFQEDAKKPLLTGSQKPHDTKKILQ